MSAAVLDRAQIRRHFSEHADEYDRYAQVQKKVAKQLVTMATVEPVSGVALDIGTGTGAVGARLMKSCPDIFLTVSDLAHEMTAAAACNLPGSFAVDADAHRLPFRSETFDLVLSASVYQWVENLTAAFTENYRILQSGGRFAFALFCDGTLGELEDVFRRALQQHCSDRPFHFQSFPKQDLVCTALRAAGFRQVESEIRHEAEYHDSCRDLLVSLKKIGAQNASSDRPTGLFPRRVLMEMERLYRQDYHSEAGLCATYSVLYGIGHKP
jgi:malonyl-CoA O-methyltransferase